MSVPSPKQYQISISTDFSIRIGFKLEADVYIGIGQPESIARGTEQRQIGIWIQGPDKALYVTVHGSPTRCPNLYSASAFILETKHPFTVSNT